MGIWRLERVKMRFKNVGSEDGNASTCVGLHTESLVGMASSATELLRVVPPYVSVSVVLEDQSILLALLPTLLVHFLAVMKEFGVRLPLPLLYRLGHIVPRPRLTSILLYRLCASAPVPKSIKNT
jgi:hypothetical protein